MRDQPSDPDVLTLQWVWHEHSVIVWEDANEVLPWTLRWVVDDPTGPGFTWQHEESFGFVWDALARAAVLTSTIENDERLVQSNVNVPADRRAFEHLVTQFIAFTSAPRESTRPHHHTRAGR